MKKHLLIFCLLVAGVDTTAQTVVNSKNTRYQMEREVITRWNNFDPKWYFILFHNKYRTGEDRRNMKQLLPLMAATKLNAIEAEQENKDLADIRDQEMFKMADRSLNKSWHLLYESKVTGLNNRIAQLNTQAIAAGIDFNILLALKGEQERINADINLTKESYEDDAKKAEQFRIGLTDLTMLRGYYLRLLNLYHNLPKNK